MSGPMMVCGHTAQGHRVLADGSRPPVCVICDCVEVASPPPDLDGRTSRCSYFNPGWKCPDPECSKAPHCPPNQHTRHGGNYPSEAPSSTSLPFFHHKPGQSYDSHFCGCWGWD